MNIERIIETVEKIALPIVEEHDLELVDIELVKEGVNWFLRVIIDKEDGIDIDDCGKISEKISKSLDAIDPIEESYFLEVCSPGAERPLKSTEDILNAIGEYVYIKTNTSIANQTEFEGVLTEFNNDNIIIEINKKQIEIPYQDVSKIRLSIQF